MKLPGEGLDAQAVNKMGSADPSVFVHLDHPSPPCSWSWCTSLQAKAGAQFEVLFRFYGPEKPVFDKTWKLPDIEKTK
jgi:hypothetical protein